MSWTSEQVQSWLDATLQQFKLSNKINGKLPFDENGKALLKLSEEEFIERMPEVSTQGKAY